MGTMPPGIITRQKRLRTGMIYEFSHQQLGTLGRLILTDATGRGIHISAKAEQGDMSDPNYR